MAYALRWAAAAEVGPADYHSAAACVLGLTHESSLPIFSIPQRDSSAEHFEGLRPVIDELPTGWRFPHATWLCIRQARRHGTLPLKSQ